MSTTCYGYEKRFIAHPVYNEKGGVEIKVYQGWLNDTPDHGDDWRYFEYDHNRGCILSGGKFLLSCLHLTEAEARASTPQPAGHELAKILNDTAFY